MRTFALFMQKTLDFSKFMVYPYEQEGRGSIFRDFVWTSFMDGPLLACSYVIAFCHFGVSHLIVSWFVLSLFFCW